MLRPFVLLLSLCLALPVLAQDARPQGPGGQAASERPTPPAFPADSVTRHSLRIGEATLDFTATAGSIVIDDQEGRPQARVAYVAYLREGAARGQRPVVFALNGGPGASSSWLHLGMIGPWRIDLARSIASMSAPVELLPNPDTWADAADLVFIDPPGTGFSRLANADRETRERWYSVDGDVELLASFIRRWLTRENRVGSPVIIAGESYGGYRAPRIARSLQQTNGIAPSGLVLISPVLDFAWRVADRTSPLPWISNLPPMAASARAERGAVTRADLADVEAYARTQMAVDLLAGKADAAAVARLVERVTAFTGLDRDLVARSAGRAESWVFQSRRRRDSVASGYDATVFGLHPRPDEFAGRFTDPILDTLPTALTSAMLELYGTRLNWKPSWRYESLNRSLGGGWRWGQGQTPPTAMPDLIGALALDPRLDVVVAHGLFDLVTSYFQSALILDQIPPSVAGQRVRLVTYEGGHMYYDRADSRAAMRAEFGRMLERIRAR